MKKRILWLLVGILLLVSLIGVQGSPRVEAEENMSTQIHQILKNQEKILKELGEIKKELATIRVRVN